MTYTERLAGDVEYLLTLARAVITDPKNWCQKTYHTEDGARCASGALAFVGKTPNMYFYDAYELLRQHMGGRILEFNDTHRHAEVLAAFDAAIAEARRLGV